MRRGTMTAFRMVCAILAALALCGRVNYAGANETLRPLTGTWRFALDREDKGLTDGWFAPGHDRRAWREVSAPHTWQVELGTQEYYGVGWYARTVAPAPEWQDRLLRLEFDAVYRDASVWLNGQLVGGHAGSGWTPFACALNEAWKGSGPNEIVVRVDNRFSSQALPYQRSSDWAMDGGLIRGVRLRAMPRTHIARLHVHAAPEVAPIGPQHASVETRLDVAAAAEEAEGLSVRVSIYDPSNHPVLQFSEPVLIEAGGVATLRWKQAITDPLLWHFDHPHLYRIACALVRDGRVVHEKETAFGIRKIDLRDGRFHLNGEAMRLMGVEWMPGSDPRYGMAESPEVMREILQDMKRLNCIITRFHWQQDEAVFDFGDREGMLIQEEVPAWGGETMRGRLDDIQARHTREMILPHYNHPSIFAWGVGNEIGGQRPAAFEFVRKGRDLARALDPHRPLTYASNSLQTTPERDAAGLLDFIEWNDYYESWYGGGIEDVTANLQRIHDAFPTMTVVVSEYGLCECSPKNPVGDPRRIEILRTHTDRYRAAPWVAGAIFFDYNDYRTHIGDKGQGEFKQRVHGVVDLMQNRKPSWEALRREMAPVRRLAVSAPDAQGTTSVAHVEIVTRALENDFPAYTLRGYELIWTAYNALQQPMGTGRRALPDLPPGTTRVEEIAWPTFPELARLRVEIFRPTGYAVLDAEWKGTPTP